MRSGPEPPSRAVTAIAKRLFLSDSAVSKYTTSLFGKLGITEGESNNRRVSAVLAYLDKS